MASESFAAKRAAATTLGDLLKYIKSDNLKKVKDEEVARFPFTQDNACVQLDAHVRDLDFRITEEAKITVSGGTFEKRVAEKYLEILKTVRAEKSALFNKMNCQNKLELVKLNETASIISEETKKYDEDVLTASKKTSTIYLAIGGAVILIALGIIISKSKK